MLIMNEELIKRQIDNVEHAGNREDTESQWIEHTFLLVIRLKWLGLC